MNKIKKQIVLGLLIFFGGQLIGAEPLVTDRPDFTESNQIVKNATQIESGYTFSDTTSQEHIIGEVLVRHGLKNGIELRIGLPSYARVVDQETITGHTDASLGVKLKFDEKTAWILGFTLPVGSDEFKDDAYNPFLKWCIAGNLTDKLDWSSNIGLQGIGADKTRTTQASGSFSISMPLTNKLGTYYEYYVISPVEKGEDSANHFNIGTTYLVKDNLQLDARIGKDLSQKGYFIGFGVSYKR